MTRPALVLLLALALHASEVVLAAATPADARGGRVGWARLVTPHSGWGIHSDQDPKLARFIRTETTLNIDPTWYSVEPGNLERLCAYPFIYVKDLLPVTRPADIGNLQEYLQRGGFIFVDPCTTRFTAASTVAFLRRHELLFTRLLPECVVRELPDSHDLFRCYFAVGVDDLFTRDMIRLGASRPPQIGMLGVFLGDRLAAVISVSGLECGWPQTPQRMPGCMKMIVNAYVYAMTRATEPIPSEK